MVGGSPLVLGARGLGGGRSRTLVHIPSRKVRDLGASGGVAGVRTGAELAHLVLNFILSS